MNVIISFITFVLFLTMKSLLENHYVSYVNVYHLQMEETPRTSMNVASGILNLGQIRLHIIHNTYAIRSLNKAPTDESKVT